MLEQSNLEKLKEMSIYLLEKIPIGKTDYWPAVAQHFFVDTGFYPIPDGEGGIKPGILEEGTLAYELWQEDMRGRIQNATSANQLFVMVTKPWTLTYVNLVREFLSEKDFTDFLKSAYIRTEFPNSDPNVPVDELVTCFEDCNPNLLMNEEELKVYNALPEEVTVYRGVTSNNLDGVEALSWSLSPKKAEWFATRFPSIKGRVYSATISKYDIFAYINERNEEEVIVNPDYLDDIQVYKDFTGLGSKLKTAVGRKIVDFLS